MPLLPSKPDTAGADDAEPRVVGVESDDADDLLGALSSDTARRLLAELHDEPAPPGELADRVDTSLQNVQYHLENLEEAGAVAVVDTAYSEKGREMDVYAPADQPLVIFAGAEDSTTSIRSALSRLLGALGVLAVVSLFVQELLGGGIGVLLPGGSGASGGGGAGAGAATTGEAAAARTGSPTPQPASTPVDAGGTPDVVGTAVGTAVPGGPGTAAGVQPGFLVFLGGVTVLVVASLAWYLEL